MSIVSSSLSGKSQSWPTLYAAITLTTMATLVLELSLTRIFSVVFYYHFAFLAISIALFGLGAGGVLSYLVSARGGRLFHRLGLLSAFNALTVALALALILRLSGEAGFARMAGVYFAAAAPFALSGMTVSLAITETIERVEKVYFFDLLGAASGCLLLIPFLEIVGGPGTVLTAAVLLAASSAVWFGLARSVTGRTFGVALALALVGLVVVNKGARLLDIHSAKGREIGREEFVAWNSFSRIAVTRLPDGGRMIAIDADATTGLSELDMDHLSVADRAALHRGGPAFAYRLRPGAKTLVIGAGGGSDVARALESGSKDVTGVEINPIIANTIMRKRYLAASHGLYLRPGVRIAVEDGRSYVRRSTERYQVIQATLVDTWASTAAGAFALSENNLYTTEAFTDYLEHLTDDGILSFTRWGFVPPRESLRLLSLARQALLSLGEKQVWRHVIVVRESAELLQGWGATDTVIFSRKPFSTTDLVVAHEAARRAGFEEVYFPDTRPPGPFTELLTSTDPESFFEQYEFNVRPVTDNQPFFFYTVQPRDAVRFLREASRLSADYKINLAVPTLFSVAGVSLLAVAITLLLPPLVLRTRLPKEPGVGTFLWYFICLGAGYIMVQVGLIQKLVLLLGHPTYALTVVIFSMLISSGIGSFFSRRVVRGEDRRLAGVLAAVSGIIAVLAVAIGPVTHGGATWLLPWKVVVTVLLIVPAGFLMGMPFPSGLARLEHWHRPSLRWAWSLNAASSVLGSTTAVVLAIYAGLRSALLVGGLLYLVALVSVSVTGRYAARARS